MLAHELTELRLLRWHLAASDSAADLPAGRPPPRHWRACHPNSPVARCPLAYQWPTERGVVRARTGVAVGCKPSRPEETALTQKPAEIAGSRKRPALVSASTSATCSSKSRHVSSKCECRPWQCAQILWHRRQLRLCRKMCCASEPAGVWRTLQEPLPDICIHLLLLVQPIPLEEGNRYNLPPHR